MKKNFVIPVFIAAFAALIGAGAFIAIPAGVTVVPIVMQNMFAVLSGCLLGGLNGGAAALLFVLAGTLGLPVFSGGRSGVAHILGPTGGFLIGYILAAAISGLIAGKPKILQKTGKVKYVLRIAVSAAAGFVVLYVPGVLWFMHTRNASFASTMAACVLPFILGDVIKCVLTVLLSLKFRPVIARYLNSDERP
ncbi:biotin transporter BioY [Treponema parvum]|uniref:biotin transporter BioY n=1 Tax=Treponema parvum TaxID=138851 RepID=UPI001AEC07AC|nr:biotin transporter BioY [Treponema parvum]QTQ16391.1 biotin transporter BioY [Treponema parvum]